MNHEIRILPEKRLIGHHMKMSLMENKTHELWKGFMQERNKIKNAVTNDLFSMQVYDASFDFKDFDLNTSFIKWAAVEVPDFLVIPEGMTSFTLPQGLYAVFFYQGAPEDFATPFQYIFDAWLPGSGYVLDNRPHFEILGEKYKNGDPHSEEEIWIPVRMKGLI